MSTHTYEINDLGFKIVLTQYAPDRFSVQYGSSISNGRTYAEAAKELGEAILHALACEGRINPQETPEPSYGRFSVLLTFQYPGSAYRNGVTYHYDAKDKAQAIRFARRDAEGDGHLGLKQGRATFKATKLEE